MQMLSRLLSNHGVGIRIIDQIDFTIGPQSVECWQPISVMQFLIIVYWWVHLICPPDRAAFAPLLRDDTRQFLLVMGQVWLFL